jgi:hypothetical protein
MVGIIFLWLCYVIFLFKIQKRKIKFNLIIVPALLFSILLTIDFAVNYSLLTNSPFGLDDNTVFGLFSRFFIKEHNYKMFSFRSYYLNSMTGSVLLLLLYMIAILIDNIREEKRK